MDPTAGLAQPELPPSQLRRSVHQTKEARLRFWRVIIVTGFFAILIGGNLLAAASFIIDKAEHYFKTEDLSAKYKTARISRPMLDGVFCHSLVLDNKTGQAIEDKIERCDASNATARRGQTQFIWGGAK